MRTPAILFCAGLAVYAAFAGPRVLIHGNNNHFVYLADAFLHGSLELVRTPPHGNDWASYEIVELKGESAEEHGPEVRGFFTRRSGKPDEFRTLDGENLTLPRKDRGQTQKRHFVSFPPMPAVLMLPMVAAAGYGTNDVLFTIFFAALNAMLAYLVCRRLATAGHSARTPREDVWLAVFFAFGTAHFWCSVLGQVWFTALIVGATFNLAFVYFAIDARRPLLAGLCLAAAFSTRAALVFAAVFFYHQLYVMWHRGEARADLIRRFAWFSAPCLVVGVTLLIYNYARFHDPMEFGHRYLANGSIPRIRDFGLFHPDFINRNLTAAFTLVPKMKSTVPYFQISKHGLGLVFTTPALFFVLWPRRQSEISRSLWLTLLVVFIPILFYQNTGWIQFSYRFAIDILPYGIALLAIGGRPISRWFKGLIVYGIIISAFGAVTFDRSSMFYSEFMTEEPKR